MTLKVVHLDAPFYGDIPVPQILDSAKHLDAAMVLGEDANGKLWVSCSHSDTGWVMMMLARAQSHFVRSLEEHLDNQPEPKNTA